MNVRQVLLVAILAAGCGETQRPDVLIVTLDTTRADAIGIYGSRSNASPTIDAVARDGVVFDNATSPVPLTLPSHTSLFTGMFPPHHGVRENGSSIVSPDLTTLAELFRDAGYETGAFVGAYVLDARWGLDQGFDQYSGRFDASKADIFSIADLERPADQVVNDALRWLQSRDRQKPAFTWVHLFDPHTPFAPPSPFNERYADDPYAGEIAFADSQLARLLAAIDRENTVIVIAGDHGEGFGEHEEKGHGLLLYEEVLHVPLVVAAPGNADAGRRVVTPVSLVDVFATVAELAGLTAPPSHGHSLVPLTRGGSSHATPIYAETEYPRRRFGWSDLQVLRAGPLKLIESSKPELYELSTDPGETRDLADDRSDVLRTMRGRLRRLIADLEKGSIAPATTVIDEDAQARLRALGYISGPARTSRSGPLPPPRTKIAVFDRLNLARSHIAAGNHEDAERLLLAIAAEEPDMLEAHIGLGELNLRRQHYPEASKAFRRAFALAPEDPAVIAALATAEGSGGRTAEALQLLSIASRQNPREPRFHYVAGQTHLRRGDIAAARKEFESVVKLNPGSAAARVELAGIALAEKEPARAADLARQAMSMQPDIRGARLFLAQALEQLGHPEQAWKEATAELEISPGDFRTSWYLAELAGRLGRDNEARSHLLKAIEAEPRFIPAYLELAQRYLERNERFDEGVRLARKALELDPAPRDRALAHFLLADFYSRLGRHDLSRQHAELGRQATQ